MNYDNGIYAPDDPAPRRDRAEYQAELDEFRLATDRSTMTGEEIKHADAIERVLWGKIEAAKRLEQRVKRVTVM